jgi:hypothetical protein
VHTYTYITALFVTALAGCGGDSNSPNIDTIQDIQTTVPSPTYAPNSSESNLFQFINDHRKQLGLGLLAQSTYLDAAARNHVNYLDTSGSEEEIISGIESASKDFYTGDTAQDRCNFVAYQGTCPQKGMWSEVTFLEHPSPYLALVALTQGSRQIGLAMHSTSLSTGMINGPELQLGYPSGTTPQRQQNNFLLATQLWGAFHVQINEGEILTVDTFQVIGPTGQDILGDVLTSTNDPLMRVPSHAAMFVPTSSGIACDSSVYTVSFSGKRNGVPFTLWVFRPNVTAHFG